MMERRHFLGAVGGMLGIPVFAGPLSGKVKLAVKYHMILEPELSVLEKFQLLRDTGFDGVEIKTDEKVDHGEVLDAIEATGIPVHGIVNAGEPEIIPAIELAHKFGSESVLSFAREFTDISYEENFKRWQEYVREALPLAEKYGIVICIENVRATFLKTAEEMARYIDSFDSPFVKSYFDLGNTITWTEQSGEHWAEVLGERIHKLDIKDRGHAEFGDPKTAREGVAGTNGGEVHWEKVCDELEANNFSGWATAEVAGGDRERLIRMREWMRDVLQINTA